MNCKKARIYLPSLATSGLEGGAAKRVAEHLTQCPDCQLSFEKTRKLQALLTLKRHEQPDEFFFRTYLSEFHRRLHSEMIRRKPFWSVLQNVFEFPLRASWMLRATLPAAALMVILVGFYSSHGTLESNRDQALSRESQIRHVAVMKATAQLPQAFSASSDIVWSKGSSDQKTVYVLERVANTPAAHELVVLSF